MFPNIAAATLIFADYAAGFLALCLSLAGILGFPYLEMPRNADAFLLHGAVQCILFAACILYFARKGHYDRRAPWWDQVSHILSASLTAFLISAVFAVNMPVLLVWSALLWLLAALFLIASRWYARGILAARNNWAIPVVLAGGYNNLMKTGAVLRSETFLTYDFREIVVLGADDAQIDIFQNLYPDADIRSSLSFLNLRGRRVIFCPDDLDYAQHQHLLTRLEQSGVPFSYIPPLEGHFFYRAELRRFFGHGIIALESGRKQASDTGLLLKNVLDRLMAAVALLLLSPLFIAIALVVKKDGGPAFHGQQRVGKGGRAFICWKFRSMIVNAPEILKDFLAQNPEARAEFERSFKLKNDPRITKIGHFLRRTSLDELPQLFNVLRGEMSLMGPRPIVEAEKKFYEENLRDYVSVRPGMTGLWQVSGRSDTGYDRRVYLDSWYVKNWSLWNDIIIFFKTILVVLGRRGAY